VTCAHFFDRAGEPGTQDRHFRSRTHRLAIVAVRLDNLASLRPQFDGWLAGRTAQGLLPSLGRTSGPLLFHHVWGSSTRLQEVSVLPPFIIEQIRQREERERARHHEEQPRLELPLEPRRPPKKTAPEDEEPNPDRGVLILEIT